MRNLLSILLISSLLIMNLRCQVSTTSKEWKIKWDKAELAEKEKILEEVRSQPKASSRPNIVIIMADDLGKYEVSAYGATHIQTPNIDQLASEGALFLNGYVTAPICSPSRAGLLTGKYQQRFGFESQPMEYYPSNFIEYNRGKNAKFLGDWRVTSDPYFPNEWELAKQGIPLTEINLAELLKASGYVTGIIGKWHLGTGKTQVPNKRGFDYQYGFYGAHSLYTPSKKTPGYVAFVHDDFSTQYQWNMERKSTAAIRRNNRVVKEEDYLTFAIRDEAISFLESHRDTSFFLYIPFSAPHIPFQAPQEYYDRFPHVADNNKRVYYAMIAALDDAIGAIHEKIRQLGLEESTMIWFLSDNGGATYTGATDNGPLKGGKITHFEGGINVPFAVKWKGHIPAGMTYSPAVMALDIFPTSVSGGNIELQEDMNLDGQNLLPYLTGENKSVPHERLYWRADHIQVIQTNKWKLILSTRDNWLYLYNLEKDLSESIDLQHERPELVKELMEYFESWETKLPDRPLWPRIMERRFVIDGKEYYFPA
jgi:arylsulfatase A-like enzyme